MAHRKVKIELLEESTPKIIIPWHVELDINAIVDSKTGEVGWIGVADEVPGEPMTFRIEKVTVPEQKANGSTTEISGEGIYEVSEVETDFDIDRFRYWGHSHGNIKSVNPSAQDDKQMKEFAETCEWFIGTIHNRDGDIYGYAIDNRRGIYYSGIEVIIEEPEEVTEIYEKIYELEEKIEDIRTELIEAYGIRDWKNLVTRRVSNLYTGNKGKHSKNSAYLGQNYGGSQDRTWNFEENKWEYYGENNAGNDYKRNNVGPNTSKGLKSNTEPSRKSKRGRGKKKK